MADDQSTISSVIASWASGAAATFTAAALGRVMYHAGEVRKMKRRALDTNLIWEIPVAIAMGMVADGVASYFHLDRNVSTAIAVGFGYLGPGGAQALFLRWLGKKDDAAPDDKNGKVP